MWLVLAKYGVPDDVISMIKSLHDSMQAGITLNGSLASVEVSNGLKHPRHLDDRAELCL